MIAEVELPERLDVGQVLVKVHYSGICGSQLGEIDGAKGEDKFLPHLLGHEGSGTVLEIGPGVRHVKAGDKVVLHWRKGLGIESPTPVLPLGRAQGQRRLGHHIQRVRRRIREPAHPDPAATAISKSPRCSAAP